MYTSGLKKEPKCSPTGVLVAATMTTSVAIFLLLAGNIE